LILPEERVFEVGIYEVTEFNLAEFNLNPVIQKNRQQL
jgi:hypothetical protein